MAKRFIELGSSKVIIAARGIKELERVKSECINSSKVQIVQIDLSKPEEVLKIGESLQKEKIDILVNNGGLSMREEFVNTNFDTCQYMMNTNCLSHIALIKGILPDMIKREAG